MLNNNRCTIRILNNNKNNTKDSKIKNTLAGLDLADTTGDADGFPLV